MFKFVQSQKIKSLVFFLLILLSIPVTVVIQKVQQNVRQHAATSSADISVDFGNRQNTSHPISQTRLGVGGLGVDKLTGIVPPYITRAKFSISRTDASFETVFPSAASATNSSLQQWSKLDQLLTFFQSQNIRPILVLDFTPPWLQPVNNPCTALGKPLSHVKPTDIQVWGQLAAATVAHIDAKFPSLYPYFEVWNEPNGIGFWCEANPDPVVADVQRLTEYKQLWAAVGPLMRAQAQKDGINIQIGGPALANSQVSASEWIPSIVNDTAVSPYIDFISIHHYRAGKTWADLVSQTQAASTNGYQYLFQDVSFYMKNGKQHNASQTPLFIDEYNGSTCGGNTSCSSDPTYAPVWNALFLTDVLNSVIVPVSPHGIGQNIPQGISYFTWNEPPGGNEFCMFGTIDSGNDCALTGTIAPYPQYFAYELFAGSKFLNVFNNGYTANAVTSQKTGVYVSGFYTANTDNFLIVNTSITDFPALTIDALNPGDGVSASATVFLLNQANSQITTSTTAVTLTNGSVSFPSHLPPLSVLGISIPVNSTISQTPTPAITQTPTLTPVLSLSPSPTSPISLTPTGTIFPSLTPTPTQPSGTALGVIVGLHGIGKGGENVNPSAQGTMTPKTPIRQVNITLQSISDGTTSSISGQMQFDTNSDANQGLFIGTIPAFQVLSGDYTVRIISPGYLQKNVSTVVHIMQNQSTQIPQVNLITGDLNGDNVLNSLDYSILASCYGDKQSTSGCTNLAIANPSGADLLDDDGLVDGGDYNLYVRELSVQTGN